jgi:Fe2+ transport system protein B
MKTTPATLAILTLAGISLLTLPRAISQTADPTPSPVTATKHHGKKCEEKLQNLTKAEKEQLKAAKKKIHEDPQLVAAKQAIKDAQTKEAREAATKAEKQLKHDLLLKEDPSLQAILDKIKSGKPAA